MSKATSLQMEEMEKLRRKCIKRPFWIWNEDDHKIADKVWGDECCFNHIIGLPKKEGKPLPLFNYEQIVFDALRYYRRVWIKKATGLGITELMLRIMAWLALVQQQKTRYTNASFAIVTGPRLELAIDLITRFKNLFQKSGVIFDDKNTVANVGKIKVEAFPSHHLDAMRGLPNVKFILLDEADFFPPGEQQDARDVSERYIGKSDPYLIMVSTPNQPGGLFQRIELEQDSQSIYHKIVLGYQVGLNKIYTPQDIDRARKSPSFEREYNLKYLGSIGNVFGVEDIDAAIRESYEIIQYTDDFSNPPRLQAVAGIDPGWGVSAFGIVVTHFVDGRVRVVYADQFQRSGHDEMVQVVWDLIQKFNITKVLVDASAPSFIRALKLQWSERPDYENVGKELREYMRVEPVAFGVEHKALLYHVKFMLENHYLQVHPSMEKLITSLRSAWTKEGTLDKELTSYHDILDALRLSLRPYKEHSQV